MSIGATALGRVRDPRPRPGYIGWVGHHNLGDEVMFEAARKVAGPDIEGLTTLSREKLFGTLHLGGGRRYPIVFLGGGTLINEGYLAKVEQCLGQGSRMATLGTGVGSAGLSSPEEPIDERWIEALKQFERVGVRGPLSLTKLRRAGLDHAEIIGDLALIHTPEHPIADWHARCVLFNAAQGKTDIDRARLARVDDSVARRLRSLAAMGWRVVPVAFDPTDHEPIRRVLEAAGLPGIPVKAPQKFEDYCVLAKSASLGIGVRLHSSVLASACGIPNILFHYRDKCLDFAESVGMRRNLILLEDFDESELFVKTDDLLAVLATEGRRLHDACLEHRDRLRNYVAALRQVPFAAAHRA